MKIKAVLFDLDETLFDRKLAQKAVLALMMKQLPEMFAGLAPDPVLAAFLESDRVTTEVFNLGVPSDSMRNSRSKLFLQLLGLNENHAGVITKMYVKDYPTVKTPVDGAVPLVKKLSKNMTVGVVSNGLPDVQYTKLETLGLRDLFSCIVLSEEFGVRKPDARIFHHAVSLLKMQPSECLYIGDSYPIDIIGAKNAGLQACWLNREGLKQQDTSVQADFTISKLQDFEDIAGH